MSSSIKDTIKFVHNGEIPHTGYDPLDTLYPCGSSGLSPSASEFLWRLVRPCILDDLRSMLGIHRRINVRRYTELLGKAHSIRKKVKYAKILGYKIDRRSEWDNGGGHLHKLA
jgi:hypothetical protein